MINFRQNLYWEEHSFAAAEKTQPAANTGSSLAAIELRLANVLVRDNNTPAVFPFPGYAKLYFLCLVASSAEKETFRLELRTFEKVDDGDALPVDKSLYQWHKEKPADVAPAQIHVLASLIKSKQPLRDVAAVLSELYRDPSFKLLSATLDNLIKGATSLPDISNLLFNLAGIVGKYLGKTDDRPLLSWYQGFMNINEHSEVLGKTEKLAANRYASMTLSLMIQEGYTHKTTEPAPRTEATPLTFPFRNE